MLIKAWDWLIWSSKNSEKISTSVKGALAVVAGVIANVIVLGHLQIDPLLIQTGGDSIMSLVQSGLGLITAVTVVISAATSIVTFTRKVIRTFKGENDLINKYY